MTAIDIYNEAGAVGTPPKNLTTNKNVRYRKPSSQQGGYTKTCHFRRYHSP